MTRLSPIKEDQINIASVTVQVIDGTDEIDFGKLQKLIVSKLQGVKDFTFISSKEYKQFEEFFFMLRRLGCNVRLLITPQHIVNLPTDIIFFITKENIQKNHLDIKDLRMRTPPVSIHLGHPFSDCGKLAWILERFGYLFHSVWLFRKDKPEASPRDLEKLKRALAHSSFKFSTNLFCIEPCLMKAICPAEKCPCDTCDKLSIFLNPRFEISRCSRSMITFPVTLNNFEDKVKKMLEVPTKIFCPFQSDPI